jgi:hypothetical protein
MSKILTYPIPDLMYSTSRELGKTSTQEYIGPEKLILYLEKDSGRIVETWAPEDDEPPIEALAVNLERVEFIPETDEDYIKIMILHSHWEPKMYEVIVGPEDDPNVVVADPTDVIMVFDETAIVEDYKAPLKFLEYTRDRSDEFIRDVRNSMLSESDGRIAEDMPDSIKQAWVTYRQKLRDLPDRWADVPNHLIRFPLSPDQTVDIEFENPEVKVIRVEERTAADQAALDQLPDACR